MNCIPCAGSIYFQNQSAPLGFGSVSLPTRSSFELDTIFFQVVVCLVLQTRDSVMTKTKLINRRKLGKTLAILKNAESLPDGGIQAPGTRLGVKVEKRESLKPTETHNER